MKHSSIKLLIDETRTCGAFFIENSRQVGILQAEKIHLNVSTQNFRKQIYFCLDALNIVYIHDHIIIYMYLMFKAIYSSFMQQCYTSLKYVIVIGIHHGDSAVYTFLQQLRLSFMSHMGMKRISK